MDAKELQLIKELMDQLQDEMKFDKRDLAKRLCREEDEKEPKGIEVLKIQKSALRPKKDEMMEPEDDEMMEPEDDEMMESQLPESSDEQLKRRLMKLRG